ncbi:MAG: hypothetical protein ABWY93_15885 [Mycobacterium sp.]
MGGKLRRWLKRHVSIRGLVMAAVTAVVAGIVVLTLTRQPDSGPAYVPKATEATTVTAAPVAVVPPPPPITVASPSVKPPKSAAPAATKAPHTRAPRASVAPAASAAPATTAAPPASDEPTFSTPKTHVQHSEPTYAPGQVHG